MKVVDTRHALLLGALINASCGSTGSTDDTDVDTEPIADVDPCEAQRLPIRDFDASGPTGTLRGDLAADFTVPLANGGDFGLAANWTGCDSVIVLTQRTPVSETDTSSIWTTDLDVLLDSAPENAQLVFVPSGVFGDANQALIEGMQARIDATLDTLDASDAAWWRERLHVSAVEASSLSGWLGEHLQTERGAAGVAIDRLQRVRDLGMLRSPLAPTGGGEALPFEHRLSALAWTLERFDYEADLEEDLAAFPTTVVPALDGVITEDTSFTVELPDATTMAGFEHLDVDLELLCPDRSLPERESCGPGNQLVHLWWLPEDDEASPVEVARLTTPYHREGRFVSAANHVLPFLQDGGPRRFRVTLDPAGDQAPLRVRLSLRLSDRGLGRRPYAVVPLWTGGPIGPSFNVDRAPVTVERPEEAVWVDLIALFSVHGQGSDGCPELCQVSVLYSPGATNLGNTGNPGAGTAICQDSALWDHMSNQHGPWWIRHAFHCPGGPIRAFESELNRNLSVGEPTTIGIALQVNGETPRERAGTAELSSWLLYWEAT